MQTTHIPLLIHYLLGKLCVRNAGKCFKFEDWG